MKAAFASVLVFFCLQPSVSWSAGSVEHYADASALIARAGLRLQEVNGDVTVSADPAGHSGQVLRLKAGARIGGRVGKSAVILPFVPVRPDGWIEVTVEVFIPKETPLNSIHLIDLECKYCGQDHNPGLRVYLRHGHLRIDRKKINGGQAWTNGAAPTLTSDRWHNVRWRLWLGKDDGEGMSVVTLNGEDVLRHRGRTVPDVPEDQMAIDRVQIGITANSNTVDAIAYLRAVKLSTGD